MPAHDESRSRTASPATEPGAAARTRSGSARRAGRPALADPGTDPAAGRPVADV